MDAHGVDILHAADGQRVALCVAHDLYFKFMPALEIALDERAADRRGRQRVLYLHYEVLDIVNY